MRNGPRTDHIADLPLDLDVLVWREGIRWRGLYKLLAIDGETCQLQLPRGPVNFRSTAVKPYYQDENTTPELARIDKEISPDDPPRRSPRNMTIHDKQTIVRTSRTF
jgi:hypothetical protein